MNSLPDSYREIKNAIKYGRESLTFETVVNALKSRDLELKNETKGEGLITKGRTPTRNWNQNNGNKNNFRSKSRSKSKARGKKCYYCQKEGHFIRECFKKKMNDKEKPKSDGDLVVVLGDFDNGEVLAVIEKQWYGMDLGFRLYFSHVSK